MSDRFEEVVATPERLRQIVSYPNQAIAKKVIDHIDDICRRFIAASSISEQQSIIGSEFEAKVYL